MPLEESSLKLSNHLINPLCSRHEHIMVYEKDGISWKEDLDTEKQTLSSYHCRYMSCTVHYAPTEGYFTVADAPTIPEFIEEPGVNIHTCPNHGTWLYQSREKTGAQRLIWRCGVESCNFSMQGNDRTGVVDHPNI